MKHQFVWLLGILLSVPAFSHGAAGGRSDNGNVVFAQNKANLSIGAQVTASSSRGGHAAAKAIDGSLDSYWQSKEADGWIMVDLKAPRALKSICQVFRQSSVWKFKLEGSLDGENWLLLVDKSALLPIALFSPAKSPD